MRSGNQKTTINNKVAAIEKKFVPNPVSFFKTSARPISWELKHKWQ